MSTTAGLHVHKEKGESHIHILNETEPGATVQVSPSLAAFDKNLYNPGRNDDAAAGSKKKTTSIEIKHGATPGHGLFPSNPMAAQIPIGISHQPQPQPQPPPSSGGGIEEQCGAYAATPQDV